MNKSTSRSENLMRNVFISVISQIVILVASFANRTIFIKLLGAEYLGIDGLFGSILSVLSLAELGLGSAIIYNLYKPVAEGNIEKAKQYLSFYATAYRWIIIVVSIIGLVFLPFLKYIIQTEELQEEINLNIIYILFLANTVSSYFLAHRQAVLMVNQQYRVVSSIQMCVKIVALLVESILLLVFRSYYLYLIIKVSWNYIQAIVISNLAKKRYPELCLRSKKKLSKDELSSVKTNVSALFIRRIGSIVLSSADNLIINGYISTVMVGIYSNYTMIVSSIQTVTVQMFSAMTATIGNFVALKKPKDVEPLFRIYTHSIYIVYGFCCVCLYTLTNNFIRLLWGETYLLPKSTLFIIVLNFFFYGFQTAINVFRDTTGLFVQGKYRALISAAVNVLFSILLVHYMGISGVILATVISRVFVSAWYDPYVLYKHFFKSSVGKYYLRVILYTLLTSVLCLASDFVAGLFGTGIVPFVLSAAVALSISLLLLLPFIKTRESKEMFKYAGNIVNKIVKKIKL